MLLGPITDLLFAALLGDVSGTNHSIAQQLPLLLIIGRRTRYKQAVSRRVGLSYAMGAWQRAAASGYLFSMLIRTLFKKRDSRSHAETGSP